MLPGADGGVAPDLEAALDRLEVADADLVPRARDEVALHELRELLVGLLADEDLNLLLADRSRELVERPLALVADRDEPGLEVRSELLRLLVDRREVRVHLLVLAVGHEDEEPPPLARREVVERRLESEANVRRAAGRHVADRRQVRPRVEHGPVREGDHVDRVAGPHFLGRRDHGVHRGHEAPLHAPRCVEHDLESERPRARVRRPGAHREEGLEVALAVAPRAEGPRVPRDDEASARGEVITERRHGRVARGDLVEDHEVRVRAEERPGEARGRDALDVEAGPLEDLPPGIALGHEEGARAVARDDRDLAHVVVGERVGARCERDPRRDPEEPGSLWPHDEGPLERALPGHAVLDQRGADDLDVGTFDLDGRREPVRDRGLDRDLDPSRFAHSYARGRAHARDPGVGERLERGREGVDCHSLRREPRRRLARAACRVAAVREQDDLGREWLGARQVPREVERRADVGRARVHGGRPGVPRGVRREARRGDVVRDRGRGAERHDGDPVPLRVELARRLRHDLDDVRDRVREAPRAVHDEDPEARRPGVAHARVAGGEGEDEEEERAWEVA